jgi:hypothetical protein
VLPDAGEKLLRIRDEPLYREEYSDFESFCREILWHSKSQGNRLTAFVLLQDLVAQGITVLPDCERVARELAKYPKNDRKMIWHRALQIADRNKPNYKAIRQAALEIVPAKQQQQIWTGQLIEKFRAVKRELNIWVDFSGASVANMKTIAALPVDIEKRVSEISIHAGKRIDELDHGSAGDLY